MADTTEQLGLNLKINEAIKERNVLMEKQRSLIIDQIAISRELCNAMECVDTDKVSENILRTKESLEALFEASDKASNNLDKVSGKLDKTKKAAGGLAAGAAGAVTFFKGFNKVLGAVTGQIGNLVKGAWTIVKAFGQIAKSIISIPFKMMEGLVDLSNRWGRITEYAKALEDVREKFGDLQKGTSQILKESMIPMREQFGKLTAAGHGFSATFGVGPEGMANALRFNAELMEKLNGGTQQLRESIGENIAAMAIYRKGMGLTAEQQATLIQLADAQGKSITGVQHEFAKFSLGMGKRFGLDSKLIAKSMADMTANVGDFGTLSTKQLAQVATYTQKLGIETKALQGVIKKYDDFESAAKSAAMLNQTFGMQVDVMRMMKDEDPASRLSQLQKSFQATGKSYEQLGRAERRRLAELAGLDDKSAALAFSQGGLSKSYEEVQAAGEETEVGFKDINETLKELSKNMKKIFHEPDDYKSFFQAFMRGFERGIMLSKPMLTLMRNLRQSLHIVERAGRQVGRAFVEMFPGVKQVLTGLSDFFNPGTTRQRMSKVVASFKEFFKTLQSGPKAAREAVGKLWDDLTGNFTSFFGSKSGTTSKIFEGLKTFGAILGNVALNFGIKVLENVSRGLRVIGDFFKNLKGGMGFGEALEAAFDANFDVGGFFSDAFGDAFADLGDVIINDLWPSLRSAFLTMWDYVYKDVLLPFWESTVKPWLSVVGNLLWEGIKELGSFVFSAWLGAIKTSFKEGNYGTAAAIFLVPLIVMFGGLAASAASAFLTVFGPAIGKGIVNALEKGDLISKIGKFASKTGSAGTKIGSTLAKSIGKVFLKLNPYTMLVALAVESGMSASEQMERMGSETVEKFGLGATKSAAGLTGVIQALTLGLLPESVYANLADWFAEFFGGGEQDGIIGVLKAHISTILAVFTDLLMGIGDAFGGIWDFLMGILTFDFERIGLGVLKFFSGIGNAFIQIGFTVVESVVGAIKRMLENAQKLPWIGGMIPDSAIDAVDGWVKKVGEASEAQRKMNAEMQNMKSETQLNKEAQAQSQQQQQSAAATPTDQEQAQARLSSLRAAESMLGEIKKLEGVDKKLEDAIKTMPDDRKIQQIKRMTAELVKNLNRAFAAMQEELTNVKIDERFKADMFNNKIMSNLQGLITLKDNIKKMADSGPSPRRIEASMTNLKLSLVKIKEQSQGINNEATNINRVFGATSTQLIGQVTSALETLKRLGDSVIEVQKMRLDPDAITKKMADMKKSLENLKTGLQNMQSTITSLGDFGSLEDVPMPMRTPEKMANNKNISESLAPIDTMLGSIKGTMEKLKDIQSMGLNHERVGGQINQIKSSLTTIKTKIGELATSLGDPTELNRVGTNVGTAVSFFNRLDRELTRLQEPAVKLVTNVKNLKDSIATLNSIGRIHVVDKKILQDKMTLMKDAARAFVDGVSNMITGEDAVSISQAQSTFLESLNKATSNYVAAVNSLKQISTIRINAETLQTKMDAFEGLLQSVVKVSHNMWEINDAVQTLQGPPINDAKIQAYLGSIDNMMFNVGAVMNRFTVSLPENVLAKAQQTIAAVAYMDSSFRELSNSPVIATAIAIGESFQGGGTVTFRHENININLAVNVQMSAEEIARGIIKTTVRGSSGKADEEIKIVTNPEKPDFSY